MTIIALPIIDKQYWILKENDRKIGNVEACDGGYQVKINNQVAQFKTIKMAAQRINIQFEKISKSVAPTSENLVYGYTVQGRCCNPMWDVKMKLPVYAKSSKSKSWFAAGWYRIKRGRNWTVCQSPKLIVLQRYTFQGPFHSKEAADEHASS
jgi:hypothetical protein